MSAEVSHPRTYLFTIRLWTEPSGCTRGEVRMRVSCVLSGETRYFRDWPGAVRFMHSIIETTDLNCHAQRDRYDNLEAAFFSAE